MIERGCKSRQVIERIGGASRDRTDDLIVANDALSQLSYSPVQVGSVTQVFYQPSGMRTKRIPRFSFRAELPQRSLRIVRDLCG
jgi:hypothetical protein